MDEATRTVGEGGTVSLPLEFRERIDIQPGAEVRIRESHGRIIIEPTQSRSDLADGYQERAAREDRVADELAGVSSEANDYIGNPPDW